MPKLRHIAMVVEEIEQTAQFYEKCFGMKRVRQHETAIGLSDGVVSLVIIHPSSPNMKGDDRRGLHHLGFLVDDIEEASARVEANGAKFHGGISAARGAVGERKYLDPNGQIFDLTGHEYARDTWQIEVEETAQAS
ncbi:MAG TPA: VOC family protein [Burkholderiales bacterium]|nr:VOC family protein [Burkholderiales bacterium]